jgi:hypothetical protein
LFPHPFGVYDGDMAASLLSLLVLFILLCLLDFLKVFCFGVFGVRGDLVSFMVVVGLAAKHARLQRVRNGFALVVSLSVCVCGV